ncbi:MAG: cupin domain-containing protein [Lachnospiraceae bacterium]|nr:cupin domain-containing protein [Lachnospiraceae bacterium]
MNIVLLSGGSGKRLWPLSNDIRSKQFIKIFKTPDGSYESMVQRMYGKIRMIDPDAVVTIATSKSQVSSIHNQIGTDVGISVEPCRRDTFPAIALASSYLHHVQGVGEDEPVIVCPIDPYVEDDYFKTLSKLSDHVASSDANLSLMGIEPTYPSEKYGYVIPKTRSEFSPVSSFKEKPDEQTAKEYIEQGALWNAGVFGFKLGYMLRKTEEILGTSDYKTLFDTYETLTKISFDYAVGEKEPLIDVLRFSGEWKDLGTWNTLTEAMDDTVIGQGILNDSCENVNILNELDMPVLAMGLKDVIIAASPEGILVSDLHESSYIKPYVDSLSSPVMFAEKSWGEFRVIDVGDSSLTIRVTLNAGHEMNYHSHEYRDEIWNIISGEGAVLMNGEVKKVGPGDVISIPAGAKHMIRAFTSLRLMEIQLGTDIRVTDKIKYDKPDGWADNI